VLYVLTEGTVDVVVRQPNSDHRPMNHRTGAELFPLSYADAFAE